MTAMREVYVGTQRICRRMKIMDSVDVRGDKGVGGTKTIMVSAGRDGG